MDTKYDHAHGKRAVEKRILQPSGPGSKRLADWITHAQIAARIKAYVTDKDSITVTPGNRKYWGTAI